MATTVKELEKVLKEHEKTMARMEVDSQAAMAELQFNVDKNVQDRMVELYDKIAEKMAADQELLLKQFQAIVDKDPIAGKNGSDRHKENENRDTNGEGADYKCTRYGRIDFPKFSGTNVEGWVYKCNHFFVMDRTPSHMRLRVAVVNLEDRALEWHQAYMQAREATVDDLSWEDYVSSIVTRFSTTAMEDAMEDLKLLQQTGELPEYNNEFDRLLNKVNIPEPYAISLYVGGLKAEIRCMVKLFKPTTLRDAYALSKQQTVVCRTLFPTLSSRKNFYHSLDSAKNDSLHKITGPTNAAKLPLLPTPPSSQKITKRLTPKEVEVKRAKGECFWCSEKFTPGHKCKNRQLFVIELCDEEEDVTVDPPVIEEVFTEEPHISIHALTGIHSYSTMQIKGSMGTRTLHILIDSGSTHNFIDEQLAIKLHCQLTTVKPLKVTVANGNQLSCGQMCNNFSWMMQGVWFKADVLAIPLENYDMVLGVQWLSPLGDIIWNFANLTMQFQVDGISYTLKGIESNKLSLCSMEKLACMMQHPAQVVPPQLFGMHLVYTNEEISHCSKVSQLLNDEALTALLADYKDVFAVPKNLPPCRPYDHQIILKEGTKPINLKPYRYQAAQKDVIENMTQELLDAGVIRHSKSSFASPVVLVRRKIFLGECA